MTRVVCQNCTNCPLCLVHIDGNNVYASVYIVPVHGKRSLRGMAFLIELCVNESFVFRLEYLSAYGNSNTVVTWLHL